MFSVSIIAFTIRIHYSPMGHDVCLQAKRNNICMNMYEYIIYMYKYIYIYIYIYIWSILTNMVQYKYIWYNINIWYNISIYLYIYIYIYIYIFIYICDPVPPNEA